MRASTIERASTSGRKGERSCKMAVLVTIVRTGTANRSELLTRSGRYGLLQPSWFYHTVPAVLRDVLPHPCRNFSIQSWARASLQHAPR